MFSSIGNGGLFGNSRLSPSQYPSSNTFGQANLLFGQSQGPTTSIDHVGTPFTIKNRDGYLVASITASMSHLSLEELRINDHFAVKRGQIPDGKKQAIDTLIQNNIRKRDDPTATVTPTPTTGGLFGNPGVNPYTQQGGIFPAPSNLVSGSTGGLFGASNAANPQLANQTGVFPTTGGFSTTPFATGLGLPGALPAPGFSGFGQPLSQQATGLPAAGGFGQSLPQQGAGVSATGGLFGGNKPATTTETTTPGSLFSNIAGSPPPTQGLLLGAKPEGSPSVFAQSNPTPSGSIFSTGAVQSNTTEQPKPTFLGQAPTVSTNSVFGSTATVFGGAGLQTNENVTVKPTESSATQGRNLPSVIETKKTGSLLVGNQSVVQPTNPPVMAVASNNIQNNQSMIFSKPQSGLVPQQNAQSLINVAPSLPQSQTVSSKPGGYAYEMNKMLFTYSLVELFGEHNIVYPEELLEETDFMPKLFDFLATYGIKPPTKFVPKFKMNKSAILSVVAPEHRESMREQEARAQELEEQQRPVAVRQEINNQKEDHKQEEKRGNALFQVGEVNTKKEEKNEKDDGESEKEESAVVVGEGSHEENGNSEKELESQGQTSTENQ